MLMRLMICFTFCFTFYSCSSSTDHKVSAGTIESSIKKGEDINYYDQTITGDLNIIDTGAVVKLTPVQNTTYVRSALVFRNCTFKGKVIASLGKTQQGSYSSTFMKNVFFDNCLFEDDFDMEGATINGVCTFATCTFKKGGLFNRTTFDGTATFSTCTFMGGAGFQQCTFMGSTFFNAAHFEGTCFFQNAYFYRELTFTLVHCDDYTAFSSATFYSNVFCNYTHFKKSLDIGGCSFGGRAEFVGVEFFRADFDGSYFFGKSLFDKSNFSESLSLHDCRFVSDRPSTTGYKAAKSDMSGAQVSGATKMTEF